MSLPDASRLLSLPKQQWRRLGLRLEEIGVNATYVRCINQAGSRLINPVRAPLRKWHLRRLVGPAAYAVRLLMFGEGVKAAEAQLALGKELLSDLIDVGLIQDEGDSFFSPFYLKLVMNGIYILCDNLAHRENAVMGVGETTGALGQAVWPVRPVERVLDLGCGAGTLALLLANRAHEVLGTDINPRAVIFSRVNAAINGKENVQFCEGDGFSAVANETFDLIVSQPPFVSLPKDVVPATYLYGGHRGDELPSRLLSEVEPYLSTNGRAVFLIQWPVEDEPLETRIRALLHSDGLNLLVVRQAPTEADDISALYALSEHLELGADFEQMTILRRDHFEALGISSLCTAYSVIERTTGGAPSWTAAVDIPSESKSPLTSLQIDTLFLARNLVARGRSAIASDRFRVPAGVVFSEESTPAKPLQRRMVVRFPRGSLSMATEINSAFWQLLFMVHEASSVADAARMFAVERRISIDEATEQIISAVEQAVLLGIVEPS
jgi:SAM-dependent methyltransferase